MARIYIDENPYVGFQALEAAYRGVGDGFTALTQKERGASLLQRRLGRFTQEISKNLYWQIATPDWSSQLCDKEQKSSGDSPQ